MESPKAFGPTGQMELATGGCGNPGFPDGAARWAIWQMAAPAPSARTDLRWPVPGRRMNTSCAFQRCFAFSAGFVVAFFLFFVLALVIGVFIVGIGKFKTLYHRNLVLFTFSSHHVDFSDTFVCIVLRILIIYG